MLTGPDGKHDKAAILVTILVEARGAPTETLMQAGLTIQDVAKSLPIVVGRTNVADLEKLALVETVRRIEKTRMD